MVLMIGKTEAEFKCNIVHYFQLIASITLRESLSEFTAGQLNMPKCVQNKVSIKFIKNEYLLGFKWSSLSRKLQFSLQLEPNSSYHETSLKWLKLSIITHKIERYKNVPSTAVSECCFIQSKLDSFAYHVPLVSLYKLYADMLGWV